LLVRITNQDVAFSLLVHWRRFPMDSTPLEGITQSIPVTEEVCDMGLATAKVCMFMQFPDL